MKNLKNIILIVVVVLSTSCEDILKEENRNAPTAELLYNTDEGIESLVNACYAHARVWYGKTEGWAFSEMGTDLWTYTGGSRAIPFGSYSSDLQGSLEVFTFMWNALYSGLNTCNTALANLPNAPLDQATVDIREGEVRFLRAFFLWHIVETWGEAPMQLDVVNTVVTTAEHTSVDDFYKQIFEDLDVAIQKLAPVTEKGNGRITLNAAKAFKARMLLGRKQYQEASDLAKEVINSNVYSMYDSFAETFDINNAEGTTNNEAIWWVNYSEDYSLSQRFDGKRGLWLWEGGNHAQVFAAQVYWDFPGTWVTPDVNRPYVNSMPTLALLNMFDETKDERYDVTFRSVYYANNADFIPEGSPIQVGDTSAYCTKYVVDQSVKDAKPYTIVDQSAVYEPDGTVIGSRDHFISLYKFSDNLRPTGWEGESRRDAFVIRISEMYMIVAEAALMEDNLPEAVTYINAVREKRALPGKEDEMKITESDLDIDFILDERAREFAGEQLRWFDLKRTGKLIERVKKYNPDAAPNIKDFHRVRPFPLSELDAITNKEEFTQNEGYN